MSKDTRFHDELNFRGLGGYPTQDGRKIKKCLFYRSGGLSRMTKEELDVFRSLGIHCILDLRTQKESKEHPDPDLGIEMLQHSGVVSRGGEEIDFSPKGMYQIGEAGQKQLEALKKYYAEMPFHNEAFHVMVDEIVKGNVPICFHCATGKDRTGVAAMILLLILGVDEKIIFDDYMLSSEYRRERLQKILTENKDKIEEEPVLGELLTMKEGVSPEVGHLVLHEMKTRYGSYDAYLEKEFNLTKDRLNTIRDRYLV